MENKTFNISMPKALLDAIDKQAETEFRNRSDLIREATRVYLSQKGSLSFSNSLIEIESKRIQQSLEFSDFSLHPVITLSCTYRPQPNSVVDIFAANSQAVQHLEHPPKLRSSGWDLDTLDRARPVAGEYLEVKNGMRKLLRLYRDGQHIFAAGMDFFGWAVNQGQNPPANFNLLSVAELITNFVNLSLGLSKTLEKGVSTLIFTIVISNPQITDTDKKSLKLLAYDGLGTEKAGEFSLSWAERNIVIQDKDNIPTERIAYLIYSEFCYFFGSRSDELWYVSKDKQEIDKEVFLSAGR